jgi:hypothetical protein
VSRWDGAARWHFPGALAGLPMQTKPGAQSHHDGIRSDLNNGLRHVFLSPIGKITLLLFQAAKPAPDCGI